MTQQHCNRRRREDTNNTPLEGVSVRFTVVPTPNRADRLRENRGKRQTSRTSTRKSSDRPL